MKIKKRSTFKIIFNGVMVAAIVAGGTYLYTKYHGSSFYQKVQQTVMASSTPANTEQEFTAQYKNQYESNDKSSSEFQKMEQTELDTRFYNKVKADADAHLKVLEGQGFKGQQISFLRKYLNFQNPELGQYADQIVNMPNWVETVAIIGHETSFCTAGVGVTKNDCGGIGGTSNPHPYKSKLASIQAVSDLLSQPMYKNLAIADLNGIYCQDSTKAHRKCTGWTEHVESIVDYIRSKIV